MELWEFLLALIIITPILVLWLGCVIDVIGRPDLGGGMKVLWLLFVLLLPLFGSLVYILVRPKVIVASPNVFDETWGIDSPQGPWDVTFDPSRTPKPPSGY